ncbi:MAG: YhdH/YhfP family quinone oxidoreductase [Flavobacteriales bacterium]|jgi:acrylyl-CoA reductase (NADPH)|nr:YhdH/YhfP family quinone oxidoreductase [Flavobacteriales bacterium]MBT3964550.1 YhdH/YhfP family quinone oxidoreductase [Flavobacteriales bacterium]MBT4705530.1 YhdH/YhfP family quinone oxidoreductase [Flavobacteriales bacterium]MBT4930809.1 YhdH/YhfP family quinone oxidoreductase [Flavobacteriales bacterium]MBT5132142.1 YhdH/YhfP family quinone oxidoreductase [Flavobacteriales bacterium]
MEKKFRSLVVREQEDGSFQRAVEKKAVSDLPEGEVLIRTSFAALNYKDALSASGHKGITREFPHTPGVDACGIVEECNSDKFKPGDKVIVTGYDFGMNTSGGFQEYVRVPVNWVVPKPAGLSLKEAMVNGTAGFTAALSLYKMEKIGQSPEMGEILVTGSTGGVGSMAVGILAKAGYDVIATTGKSNAHDHLRSLGAKRIEDRSYANDDSNRPLLRSKWAGAIDTVGGNTLATCVKACGRKGSVAACGLVGNHDLNMTVYPFLLNGINILGVDSAETDMALREELWTKLAGDWKIDGLEDYGTFIPVEGIIEQMDLILQGETTGRVVVDFSQR